MRKLVGVVVPVLAVLAVATPAGAGSTKHFEGTYAGDNFFELVTDRCAFLDDVFDFVLSGTRGPGGTLHAEDCATITDGNLYRAAGTFTIHLPGGTLFGTYTSEARLPPSLPGLLPHQITGGTGRFRGATGSCALVLESIVTLEFGHQFQSGTWSCDVVR